MAFKFVAIFALLAVANAGILQLDQHQQHAAHYNIEHHASLPLEHQSLPAEHHHTSVYHSAPVVAHVSAPQQHHVLLQNHQHQHQHEHEQHYPDDPHPQYKFAYDVEDAISGDSKSQTESRDGDVVHGEYSLDDADGFRRTVKYTADSVNGFNAVVHREPLQHKTAAPIHHYHHAAAPATVVKHAPVSYSPSAYTSLSPVHHDQHQHHQTYTTYEVPAHKNHHDHQYQHHH